LQSEIYNFSFAQLLFYATIYIMLIWSVFLFYILIMEQGLQGEFTYFTYTLQICP
jgi:hypothetical protein